MDTLYISSRQLNVLCIKYAFYISAASCLRQERTNKDYEGSLLPKYRDCTTSNDFELYIYNRLPLSKATGVVENFGLYVTLSSTLE